MEPVLDQQDAEAPPAPSAAAVQKRRRQRAPVRGRGSGTSTERWLAYGLILLIPGTALAVGTVHVEVLLVAAAISIVAGLLALRARTPLRIQSPMRAAVWVAIVLIGWTVVQAMPLPLSWVRWIAPANGDVWFHALDALGQPPPKWASLSLDPGASWTEALKGVSYLCVMLAGCVVACKRGASFGIGLVFVSALLCATATIAHGLLGLDRVFGVYEPHYSFSTWHIGPFLNANHLAGYLNLGTMCGLGLVLMRKPVVAPWLVSLGVMLLIGCTVTSASRGAVVLLPVGLGGLAALAAFHARRQDAKAYMRPARLLALGAGAMGAFLALLGITTSQMQELLDKDLGKLSMFSWGRPLIAEHRWVGIGRGAFETVFPAFNQVPGHTTFTHPENLIIQWITEWGVVGAGAGLVMAWALRPRAVGAYRSMLMAGAWTGIAVLVLQNLLDFSLELPSVGLAIALLIGSFWGDASRTGGRVDADETARPLWIVPAAGVVAAVIWVLAFAQGVKTPFADRETFFALSKQSPLGRDAYQPLLQAAILRHPGEPYFSLVAAERAWRTRDENPIPYLQRTLERAATYGRAHLLLGEILFAQKAKNQALLELKLATRDDASLITPGVKSAMDHTQEYDDLVRMVPDGMVGGMVMESLGGWLHTRNPEAGRRFDEAALQRDPARTGARMRAAEGILVELQKGEASESCGPEEARKACVRDLERHAMGLDRNQTDTAAGPRLRARALAALGRHDEAAELLVHACDTSEDRISCLKARLDVAAQRKDAPGVEKLLKQIASIGCTSTMQCAITYEWVGDYNLRHGNAGSALTWYDRACSHDGSNASLHLKLARAAGRLGMHARAVQAYEKAVRLKPGDKTIQAELDTAKSHVFSSQ